MVDSKRRIAGAFLIGGAMISAAFIIGSQKPHSEGGALASVAATQRTFIEIEDTDGDNVPNWQEEILQKNDPLSLSATSTYQPPDTVTGKFALGFYEDVIRSKSYGVFGDSQEELIAEATKELVDKAADELFTEADIMIIPNTDVAMLQSYGNHVASIALSQQSGDENEAVILQDAVRYNNEERLNDLEPIAAAYVNMVKLMLETPVPASYAKEHLDLLNAYNAVREDIKGMQKLYEDPLYTFVRMKRYEDDVRGLANALVNLFNTLYLDDNVRFDASEPAAKLIKFDV